MNAAVRVHSRFRVHHVCTENADLAFWLPTGDMIPEKSKIYQSSFALDFLIGPIRHRIDRRQNRSIK